MAANSEEVKQKLTKKSKNKKENQPFYDSDEEIGWGRKLTPKEVKARLNKPQLIKIHTRDRYSTPCLKQTNFVTSETTFIKNQNEMEEINRDDSIPAISEYLTASEEGNGIGNSVCSSNYLSIMEPHVTNNDKSSVYLSTIDNERSENNLVDTYLHFVQKALDVTVDGIENEYHTLETTVSSTENTDSSFSTSKSDSVVLISSDEDELESQDLSFIVKREVLSRVTEECEEKSSSFSEKEYTIGEDDNRSSFSEKEYTTGEDDNRSTWNFRTDEGTSQDESFCHSRNLSPISIPAIDLHQFNDSSASLLNNTLDRMNAILGETLSFNENAEVEEEETENKNSSSTVPQTNKCNLISGSFLQTLKSPEKACNTPLITTKTVKLTPKNTPTPSKSNIPIIKKTPDFRLPDLPNKSKFLTKSKSSLFKDIVSPVRMYINYSPKPVIQQTVHAKDKPYSKCNPSPRVLEAGNKMNSLDIPNVVYKPSKKQIFALNETTNFPFSLDKMIKKSTVIKHERHPMRPNFYQDETLDPEAELTKSFLSDCSNSSGIENISILHKKPALRK